MSSTAALKSFSDHLRSVRDAATPADTYAELHAMGVKLDRQRSRAAFLHYTPGAAAEAAQASEKVSGWAKLYVEAINIWTSRARGLSTAAIVEIVDAAQRPQAA